MWEKQIVRSCHSVRTTGLISDITVSCVLLPKMQTFVDGNELVMCSFFLLILFYHEIYYHHHLMDDGAVMTISNSPQIFELFWLSIDTHTDNPMMRKTKILSDDVIKLICNGILIICCGFCFVLRRNGKDHTLIEL